MFIEAELGDPSEFQHSPLMEITRKRRPIHHQRHALRFGCPRDRHVALELSASGKPPEIHFGWSDENPLAAAIGFFLFGEGNVPWLVRDLIRKAEPIRELRPRIVVGVMSLS